MKFSVKDLIWLITVVAIACVLWVHGKQKERLAIEREEAVRNRLATMDLLVQQLEYQKDQQAIYAEKEIARIKQELAKSLEDANQNE